MLDRKVSLCRFLRPLEREEERKNQRKDMIHFAAIILVHVTRNNDFVTSAQKLWLNRLERTTRSLPCLATVDVLATKTIVGTLAAWNPTLLYFCVLWLIVRGLAFRFLAVRCVTLNAWLSTRDRAPQAHGAHATQKRPSQDERTINFFLSSV
jgi:hypothetical protein